MPNKTIYALRMLTAALLLATISSAVPAQETEHPEESFFVSSHISLGYVVNMPEQLVGFTTMAVGLPWPGWGAYADVKLPADRGSGEDNFTTTRTAAEAEALGDLRFGEPEPAWDSVNLGLVRALVNEVAVYAGAGYSRQAVYQEYFDEQRERGMNGFYTVEDDRVGGDTLNLMAGLYLRASSAVMFQFGVESAPSGFTAGVHLVLPLGT